MNVIIANKQSNILDTLTIDIMKKEVGIFKVDDIVNNYKNMFYQKMILDITALEDYRDIKVLQKLSMSLDMSKLILLLDDSLECSTPEYLSQIISIGIYNFTKNIEGVMYLYNNPNTYRDVAQYHMVNENIITNKVVVNNEISRGVRIIGVKNVTNGAGATSLVYMMKKQLEKKYDVLAIEVDKNDFMYFNDKSLISVNSDSIQSVISKNQIKDVILIDMNTSVPSQAIAQETIYLIEPTIIKINKLMMINPGILETLHGKKVILNKSLLNEKDILDFEYESKLKVFYNLSPQNDRSSDNDLVDQLLIKLGFTLLS